MRFKLEDGRIVDTDKAVDSYQEQTYWDGRNFISKNTGSQWEHEKLYKSKRGRWYVRSWSDGQGAGPGDVRFLDDAEVVAWLLFNDHEVPEELRQLVDDVVE